MSRPEAEAQSDKQLDRLLNEETAKKLVRNLLEEVKDPEATDLDIDQLKISICGRPTMPRIGLVEIQFTLGESLGGSGFSVESVGDGLGEVVMNWINDFGYDIKGEGVTFTLTLDVDEFRELSESADDATDRDGIEAVLGGEPDEEQQARIEAVATLMGKEVDNDSSLILQPGTIRAMNISGHEIGLRFLINGSNEPEMQGGVIINTKTGAVRFHPAKTSCNEYLQTQSKGDPVALADNFIEQLQAT